MQDKGKEEVTEEARAARLASQLRFCLKIDREKEIVRETYLASGRRKETDAEHAWHMAVMALVLSEHANEKVDLLRVISLLLIHDLVEIYAGDTFAYDEAGLKTEASREEAAAERLYGMLPPDQAEKLKALWQEFEEWKTPEAKFARTLDRFQPVMLNAATDGRAWKEHGVKLSQVLKRNARTAEGSRALWNYQLENFILPNAEKGRLAED